MSIRMNFKTIMTMAATGMAMLGPVQAQDAAKPADDAMAMSHAMDMGMMTPTGNAGVSATTKATAKADGDSTQAFKAADAKMHKAMMATGYTGDADVDFLRGMIPHHEGAIDMANIVLKYGTDAEVRMLAGDIIKAQEKEVRMMNDWLAKHGPTMPVATPAAKPETKADVKPAVKAPLKLEMKPEVTPKAKANDARVEAPAGVSATLTKPLMMTPGAVITLPNKAAVTNMAMPSATLVTAAILPVSASIPLSGTVVPVTSSMPPVDAISATTAMMQTGVATGVASLPGAVMPEMPAMPAPNEEIPNAAPKMEFLDGPGLGVPAKE